ncbi:Nrap protein, partial [Cutaneotrichosporon oleaginosum]
MVKRKSLGQAPAHKKRKASPVDTEDEEEAYSAAPTLVDPMIDPQSDSDGEEDEEMDEEGAEVFDGEDDDVEEFDGEDNGHDEKEAPAAGPSRSRGLYKPPTLAELDELRAAQSTGGTTFALQLESLLSSTLLSPVPAASLRTLLGAVHDLIHALPALPAVSPRKAEARLGKGAIPFPGPSELSPLKGEPKWTLGFTAPAEVVVGGSWAVCGGYKTGKGRAGNIDIVVTMPQDMFSAKDRIGYRYFHKRAHYLAVIAAGIKKAKGPLSGVTVRWENLDAQRPIVVLEAGKPQGLKQALEVRIHASVPASTFPLATLYPSKSLVRGEDAGPTPVCSTAILLDSLQKPHLLNLHQLSQKMSGERTVDKFLALWRVWTTRRGVARARGASGWFAAMLLTWAVEGADIGGKGSRATTKRARGLGKGLGAWGALRAVWELLANTDFAATPVFIAGEQAVPRPEFINAFSDILVDPTGTVNVFAGWEKGDVQLLRHYARETLAMLEDSTGDHFADVFLNSQTLGPASFDEYMIVDAFEAKLDSIAVQTAEDPVAIDRIARHAAALIRRGLTDRARLVHTRVLSPTTFAVGLLLNSEHAARNLEMGPASDKEDECAAFRELWGKRAELRRFKNGAIAESVVWSIARPEDYALIPFRAVQWLLELHLGASTTPISTSEEWLSVIQVPESVRDAVNTERCETLGFRPMMEGYDALYNLLKSVDSELPLAVLHVAPASDLLRYSSTFVPHPIDASRAAAAPECLGYVPVAEVTLQFESSPRWPDDLAAIQKLKLAMFEKLARVAESRLRGGKVSIALDADASDIEDQASLEVLMPQGVTFRVRIHHDREAVLLQWALDPPPPGLPDQVPRPPRRLVVPALAKWTARFQHAPTHHASLAPLHHRFPSFSTATRLLKRWAAAHMLTSADVRPEALELLVARTYLDPGTLAPPASATAGFLRTLAFLAAWDWRHAPAFVPLQAVTRDAASASGRPRFDAALRADALAAFHKARSADKDAHVAWALVTESDVTGTRWTGRVGPLIAARVASLAHATLSLVASASAAGDFVPSLFATPLEHYDAVLSLAPGPRSGEALVPDEGLWAGALRNLSQRPLRLDFDPAALLVADIQRAYGDAVRVFHDVHGGRAVGLLWNPARSVPRAFRPFLGFNGAPADGEAALVTLNKEAVVAEMVRLGRGIVVRVEK